MRHKVNFSVEYSRLCVQSFPSPRLVALSRLKNPVNPDNTNKAVLYNCLLIVSVMFVAVVFAFYKTMKKNNYDND